MSTTSPTFDLTNYVTGAPTSAPITKGNFEAITEWLTVTKIGTGNLQAPYSNVVLPFPLYGTVAVGTYYATWKVPANQLAWVPIEAQLSNSVIGGGGTLSAVFEVWNGAAWVALLSLSPLAGVSADVALATAFANPYAGGIASGLKIRIAVTTAVATSDNVVATLFLKAYHIG